MTTAERRMDDLAKTLSEMQRGQDDLASTALSRIADHKHDAGDLVSGTVDVARIPIGRTASTVPTGDHGHNRDVIGEVRTALTSFISVRSAPSTTPVSTTLSFSVSPNADYLFEADLFYAATAGADLRVITSGPSGYSGRMSLLGRDTSSATGSTASANFGVGLVSGVFGAGGIGNSSILYCKVVAQVGTSSTDGTFSLLFAQLVLDSTSGNDTRLYSGSTARMTRLA